MRQRSWLLGRRPRRGGMRVGSGVGDERHAGCSRQYCYKTCYLAHSYDATLSTTFICWLLIMFYYKMRLIDTRSLMSSPASLIQQPPIHLLHPGAISRATARLSVTFEWRISTPLRCLDISAETISVPVGMCLDIAVVCVRPTISPK